MPSGPSPADRVSTTRRLRMSMTEIDFESGFVTNTFACEAATATPAGPRPTATVPTTLSVARSITETSWLPWLVM